LFPEDKLYGSYKRRNSNWDKEVIKMHPTARANGEKTRGYLFCNLWQTYILEVCAYVSAVVCLPASDHMHLEFLGSVVSRPRLCSLSRVHWVSDFGFTVSLCVGGGGWWQGMEREVAYVRVEAEFKVVEDKVCDGARESVTLHSEKTCVCVCVCLFPLNPERIPCARVFVSTQF